VTAGPLFPVAYPPPYETLWQAWRAFDKNSSEGKDEGLKAWRQTSKIRLAHGCGDDLMLACVDLYRQFLAKQNSERRKFKQSPVPKLHLSTFLRQKRWEGFLEEAKAAAAPKPAANGHAAPDARALKWPAYHEAWTALRPSVVAALRDERLVDAWFPGALYDGPARVLYIPKQFHAHWIELHYRDRLARIVGAEVTIKMGEPG
jgi:hypothetical protein